MSQSVHAGSYRADGSLITMMGAFERGSGRQVQLPTEIECHILSFLDEASLARVGASCKYGKVLRAASIRSTAHLMGWQGESCGQAKDWIKHVVNRTERCIKLLRSAIHRAHWK